MNDGIRSTSRRRILQGISGSLAALGLAACEYQSAPLGPPPVATEMVVPVPTKRPRLEPVEVELKIGPISDRNSEAFQESVRVFHSYYPGIRIRVEFPSGGASQREWIAVTFAAGSGIDVAQISGSHVEFTKYNFIRKLHEFAKADNSFNIEPYYSRIVDYYNTPGEGLWCLPWSYATETLYYNKRHFTEASIPTPDFNWTWDDVRDVARKLTKKAGSDIDTEVWGVEFRLSHLDYVLRSFGGGFPIGEPENSERIRAGNIAAMRFLSDLVKDDRVHPYPALGWSDGFALGKVSMAFLPEWASARLNAIEGLDYDVAPMPQGPAGSVTSFAVSGVAMGGYDCFHPDHSWEVLKWFAHADFGKWDVARAILFPEGMPTALIAANENCWTTHHQEPDNRRLFLQNTENAMVPFSDSPWWPHLSEAMLYSDLRRYVSSMLVGRASVEEGVERLEQSWKTVWPTIAEALSKDNASVGCRF
ncbi:MAG: extracellular solute-binding protein [Chloroflexi bacterium]|nr:extracellular solute-binding protein [Chloroflexota bacterium]